MSGYVYAIAAGDLVKIGYSADPRRRFSKLASDNSAACELLGVMPATREQECVVHSMLASSHIRGEWFKRTASVDAFIQGLSPPVRDRAALSADAHPIKSFRETANLTLEAFGERVGVQKAAVCKWENGVPPSPACARRIEEATEGAIPRWKLRPDIWPAPDERKSA